MYLAISRGNPSGNTPTGKGKCKSEPSFEQGTKSQAFTCAEKGKHHFEGNFIGYRHDEKKKKLVLINVNAEYCNPKPKLCHCGTMLDNLLASFPKLETIDGYFMADPFIKGCRCYLHSAVKANFKFVQFGTKMVPIGTDEECIAKNEISKDNYIRICENYAKKCKDVVGNGIISKK